ncbi:hypothetical protein [Vandammella animalimorsus]|uniref:hypothetical protein n=1 Tax=Vandammella animalimorsus TaxID=2029117 RepID=UPI00117F0530|nr:hypothetical protein [Vandammella animalimorsus]
MSKGHAAMPAGQAQGQAVRAKVASQTKSLGRARPNRQSAAIKACCQIKANRRLSHGFAFCSKQAVGKPWLGQRGAIAAQWMRVAGQAAPAADVRQGDDRILACG